MVSVKYLIRSKTDASNILVCKLAFLGILGVSKHRVTIIAKNFTIHGSLLSENRRGDRKSESFEQKNIVVIYFIKTFKCLESHYRRSKHM